MKTKKTLSFSLRSFFRSSLFFFSPPFAFFFPFPQHGSTREASHTADGEWSAKIERENGVPLLLEWRQRERESGQRVAVVFLVDDDDDRPTEAAGTSAFLLFLP